MKITIHLKHTETIQVINKNTDLLAEKDIDLGRTRTIQMSIDTGSHPSIKLRPYHTPFSKRQIIHKAIDDMLHAKHIHPLRFPSIPPIVTVDKKNDTKRF